MLDVVLEAIGCIHVPDTTVVSILVVLDVVLEDTSDINKPEN